MRLASALLFLALWTIFALITSLPLPHEVAIKFIWLLFSPEPVLGKTLVQHAAASLARVFVASALAFSAAIPLGIVAGWSERVRAVMMPIVDVLRPIPPLAWIPLAYIVFASLPNTVQVVQLFIVFVGAFFPCVISVFDAARSTPVEFIEMARVFKASNAIILRHVVIPHALQGISTGIRIGLAVGWMSIIAAEMVATSGEGLGYFILVMYEVGGRVAEIVSGIAMIGIIGYAMNSALLKLEEVLMPWR